MTNEPTQAGDRGAQAAAAAGGVAPVAGVAKRRSRLKKWLMVLGVLAVVGVVGAELVARFVLRLGDPPLYVADPEIEYVMKPSSTYHRFYATSTYNKWSMRATPDIEKTKSEERELRVLVIGDSVVNGGPQTDDSELATTLLGPMLQSTYQRPVVVANISAGSWGPENMLAYTRKFGFFGADLVVIVLNHEDAVDVPTFGALGPEQPTRKPTLALEEAVFRYIPAWFADQTAPPPPPVDPGKALALEDRSLAALRELVAGAQAARAQVIGVLHASRSEALAGESKPGTVRIRSCLTGLGVPTIDDADMFRGVTRTGQRVYRDEIHLMVSGQALIARIIGEGIVSHARK